MKIPNVQWVNRDSPFLRQHLQGFRWLTFSEDLEGEFNSYHANLFLGRIRWSLIVATTLFLAFAVLDAISLPEGVRQQTLGIRLGIIVPMLSLALVATYQRPLRRHLQLIIGLCSLASGLGVAGIIWVARAHDFALPYEGIILVTVYFYFLAGLRFIAASLCGWLTLLAYLLVEVRTGLPGDILLYNMFFLATANIIGGVGCYFLEFANRQNFLALGLLQELAEKDFLTGLLNRRAFCERAERSWRQALRERQPVAVVMLDVDYFKRYNDRYGHAAGDEALRAIAAVIGRQGRRALDVTARYGGEEFVSLWYGIQQEDAQALLERLRAEVEALGLPHETSEAAAVVTLSIGMAWLEPQPHQDLSDALRLADVALYLAKEQGRNRIVSKRAGEHS